MNRNDHANSIKTTMRKHAGQKKVRGKETLEKLTCLALCRPSPGKDHHQAYPRWDSLEVLECCKQPGTTSYPQPSLIQSEENLLNLHHL